MQNIKNKKVAIVAKFSAYGGISRMMVNLANGLIEQGIDVDLIIAGGEVPFPENLNPQIKIFDLNAKHVYQAFYPLLKYINRQSPDAILATRRKNITIAIMAHLLGQGKESRKLAVRLSGHISSSIPGKSILVKWLHNFPIRRLYAKADRVIAVSQGVADDFCQLVNFPKSKVKVVHNPTIPGNLMQLSKRPVSHPWFTNKVSPIILGVGRFTKRKDFVTLIKAFALLRYKRACHLVLLGDGKEKNSYLTLAEELGIENDLYLPGFTRNPYAYMFKSDVLALTSKGAEGSPNVLKESLALGLPVVSTDCPSGPREILQNGKFGHLVPVQDAQALAVALEQTLDNPFDPDFLKTAVQAYTIPASTFEYRQALGL